MKLLILLLAVLSPMANAQGFVGHFMVLLPPSFSGAPQPPTPMFQITSLPSGGQQCINIEAVNANSGQPCLSITDAPYFIGIAMTLTGSNVTITPAPLVTTTEYITYPGSGNTVPYVAVVQPPVGIIQFGTGPVSLYTLKDMSGSSISAVSVNGATTVTGFTSANVTFDASDVYISFSGLAMSAGQLVSLDVSF